jgi:hypothetical protein
MLSINTKYSLAGFELMILRFCGGFAATAPWQMFSFYSFSFKYKKIVEKNVFFVSIFCCGWKDRHDLVETKDNERRKIRQEKLRVESLKFFAGVKETMQLMCSFFLIKLIVLN